MLQRQGPGQRQRRGQKRTGRCRTSTGAAARTGRLPRTSSSPCLPSARNSAVYLVAQYARREIKRMEAEAEEKRKKEEEIEKQKQLDEESLKEDADSKLSNVLVRLDTLEGVVKEIVDQKGKVSSSNFHNKEELVQKNETSPAKVSDLKSGGGDSHVTVKSKDINGTANTPSNTTQPSNRGDVEKAQPKS